MTILLFDEVNILDVAGPAQAFSSANSGGVERYRMRYVSEDGGLVTSSCGLELFAEPMTTAGGQDLLIPGGRGVDRAMMRTDLRDFLRGWLPSGDGRRIISICSGALILAEAGLLNGRKATTHWAREVQACAQYPAVDWAINELYRIDGPILTSAGVTSGIDLALEIINGDFGRKVALAVARDLVVALKRSGGQRQFAELLEAQFTTDKELARLVAALEHDPGCDWTLDIMADVAGLTPRTLSRRFAAAMGCSPVKFLERLRTKRATDALSSGIPVGKSIELSGFCDFQQMQRAFKRQLGTTVGQFNEKFADPM